MRIASVVVILGLVATTLVAADNPWVGTWKLNVAKSKYSPGPGPKEETIRMEQDGDNIHRVAKGTNADGSAIDEDSSIPWDGKEYAVSKEPPLTVAVTKVNARTLHVVVRDDSKVIDTIDAVLSKDGRTITSTEIGVTNKGEKMHNTTLLEKQ